MNVQPSICNSLDVLRVSFISGMFYHHFINHFIITHRRRSSANHRRQTVRLVVNLSEAVSRCPEVPNVPLVHASPRVAI